jgi:carbonic anhydrase/acetyltransferase-like protein (isoleucine patch superfamily)
VEPGAVVRDSIVMFDSVVRTGAIVDQSILDKEVVVGSGAIVGDGPIPAPANRREPNALTTGITVVGKRAVVPRGARIGRNVRIDPDVKASDYASRVVPAGETIVHAESRPARKKAARRIEQAAEAALKAVAAEVAAVEDAPSVAADPAKPEATKPPPEPPPASARTRR